MQALERLQLSQDLQVGNGITDLAQERYPDIPLAVSLPALREETRTAVQAAMREHARAMAAQQQEEAMYRHRAVGHSFVTSGDYMMCSTAAYFDPAQLYPGRAIQAESFSDWRGIYGTAEAPFGCVGDVPNNEYAKGRAHALLLEHIGEKEYTRFMRRGWIRFRHKWDWYVYLDGNVWCVKDGTATKLCIQLTELCPTMDKVVALKLALENDEKAVLNEANQINSCEAATFLGGLIDDE